MSRTAGHFGGLNSPPNRQAGKPALLPIAAGACREPSEDLHEQRARRSRRQASGVRHGPGPGAEAIAGDVAVVVSLLYAPKVILMVLLSAAAPMVAGAPTVAATALPARQPASSKPPVRKPWTASPQVFNLDLGPFILLRWFQLKQRSFKVGNGLPAAIPSLVGADPSQPPPVTTYLGTEPHTRCKYFKK